MKKASSSYIQFLRELIPSEQLDEEGLRLLRNLTKSTDEGVLRAGAVELLERLCSTGHFRRIERAESNGEIRLRYRNLVSLDTVAVTVPRHEQRPSASALEGHPPSPAPAEAAGFQRELLRAVSASSRRMDLSGAFGHLLDLLETAVGFDRMAMFISEELRESQGAALTELEDICSVPENERFDPALVKKSVEETGELLYIPDLAKDPGSAGAATGRGFHSLAVAPLKADAYVYGVIELWSRVPDAYDQGALSVIGFVGDFGGGLVKRRLELQELIFVDQTTQIHNRRHFDEQLARETERCRRTGDSMALLMADLDNFKDVNDSLGHAAGDSVLRQAAQLLAQNARQVDIVARYGGEEFGIILPGTDMENARAVAERLRSTIASHRFNTGFPESPSWRLTVSIGGALYPIDASSIAELLDKVDRVALYAAKRRGRNKVLFWSDTQDE